jgi:hypothetical protein
MQDVGYANAGSEISLEEFRLEIQGRDIPITWWVDQKQWNDNEEENQ